MIHQRSLLLFGTLLLGACTPPALHWIGPGEDGRTVTHDLAALLAAHPLAPEQQTHALPLARSSHNRQLLVQIRDREPVHYHADSDISVLLVRGHGTIHIGREARAVRSGDILYIPCGVVHWFVNESSEPAAALVTYSPPPGPEDRVLVPDNGL